MSSTVTNRDRDSEMEKFIVGDKGALEHSKSATEDDSNPETGEKPATSRLLTAWSCILYSFCAVSMVLVNKSLASSYNHLIEGQGLNFLLVVFQSIIAVVAVEFSKLMGWVTYPNFNFDTAKQWMPVNVFFCAMLFTGMASLQHNSVPMVTVFKNITNILVAAGDFYFFNSPSEFLVKAAFGIMLLGAVFAAKNDASVSFVGLFWMVMNCCATAGYVLYMKFATKTIKLSKFGMVFYNNLLCTILLLPVTILNGELALFANTTAIHTVGYGMKNVFAGFVGFFLNFASLNCVARTGPSTYAIIGSLNKIPAALLGWILFNAEISPQSWFFIGVSMWGGFLYSYAKLKK